ncbi:MAG TPA: hypothetical protein VE219_05620 [Candidatus Sulfotelmatobacter sp.]|nr:hypothetical protein [Candidatus Sulfotelmatobacter sp.]
MTEPSGPRHLLEQRLLPGTAGMTRQEGLGESRRPGQEAGPLLICMVADAKQSCQAAEDL